MKKKMMEGEIKKRKEEETILKIILGYINRN